MKVSLSEVCTIQYGYAFNSTKFSTEVGVPLVRIRDVVRGYSETYTSEKCADDYIVHDGDMLIGMDGEFNVAFWKGGKAYLNQRVCRLVPLDVVDKIYLFYYMRKALKEIENRTPFVTVKHLSAKQLNSIIMALPNLDEQRRISDKLRNIDELIELRKEQIIKFDLLVKSRFIEMFVNKDYPTKTIDEVSFGKGEYGAQSASTAYVQGRPRYVRITDINDDGTLNDDVVTSVNLADDDQYRLEYGDFMFARMGATVGKTYAFIEGNQIFAGYLIRYKLNMELINPRYLFCYTKLDEYWNWVRLNQSGAAQPGINAKKFGSLRIPQPPIDLQNQFAAFVEQVDKSKYDFLRAYIACVNMLKYGQNVL